jgi:hypothetical protein
MKIIYTAGKSIVKKTIDSNIMEFIRLSGKIFKLLKNYRQYIKYIMHGNITNKKSYISMLKN